MKIKYLLFVCLIIINISIVSAETGTIYVSDTDTFTGYGIVAAPIAQSTTNYSKILFQTTVYNSISSFWITVTDNSLFIKNSNYTFFTCKTPNVCSGSVSYNKVGKIINWDFASGNTITSSPIELIYEENIFSSANLNGVGSGGRGQGSTDATHPVLISLQSNEAADAAYNGGPAFTFNSEVLLITSASYVINYTNNQYYGSIDKTGSITSLFKFENSTGIQYQESSLNTNDFNLPFIDYTTGLYINMTTSAAYNRTLINSSGATGLPEVTPTPTIDSITHAGLLWNKDNYSKMETGTLQYQYDSGLFEPLFSHWIDIINVNNFNSIEKFDGLGTSGSISYQFPNVGTFQAKYYKCLFLSCVLPSLLGTATAQVSIGQPTQLFPNQTYYVGVSSNISYYLNPYFTNDFIFYYWSSESNKYLFSFGSYGTTTGYGNKSFKCGLVTKYKITLDTAVAYVDCKNDNTHAQYNITTSYLNVSSATPTLSDYLDVDYGIASTSWINNVTSIVVYDSNNIETYRFPLPTQKGIIPFYLVQSPHAWNDMVVSQGINTLKLETEQGIILATNTINISATTAEGYGLIFDKHTYCTNEKITYKYYSPQDVNITVWDSNDVLVAKGFLNASVTGKKSSFIYSSPGTYNIRLTWNGVQYINDIITIDSCVTPSTTTPQDRTTKAMSSDWLWVALIVGGLFIVGMTEAGLAGGIVGSTIGSIISFGFGILPLWALMLYAFAVILSLALFVGSKITGNGGNKGD